MKMEGLTKVHGKMVKYKDLENYIISLENWHMKDIGKIIKHMARASSGMWTGMYLKENGRMIKRMALEFIRT